MTVSSAVVTNTINRTFVGLGNYIRAFTSDTFLADAGHTFAYVLIACVLETVLGLVLAVVLTNKYRGFKAIRTFILSPLMIAPLVAGLVWKFMLSSQFGIVNELLTRIGVIHSMEDILWLSDSHLSLIACIIADVWLTTPFMMLMFLAGIQGIPNELYESAMVEGANRWQIIVHIIIPGIKTVIFSSLVIRVIDAARTFDIIWAMTQGGRKDLPNCSASTSTKCSNVTEMSATPARYPSSSSSYWSPSLS